MFLNILLQAIIFFLPTQLGLHFWPDFARAAGIKVDYLSPTLYFLDLLLIIYILPNTQNILEWLGRRLSPMVIFLIFIVLNSAFAVSPLNSLFWWGRVLLYLLFFLSLLLRKVTWSQIKTPLLLSTFLVICLELLQLFNQSSIGGLFYWFGERNFSSSTSGLGRLALFGRDFIRPQSTFSHPNSLAGYLLVVYFLLHIHKSPLWQKIIVFLGLLVTFSKAVLLAFLLIITFHLNSLFLIFSFLLLSLFQVFLPSFPSSFQFISDRLFLLEPAKKMILSSPFFGSGLGGFVPSLVSYLPGSFLLPSKLQPVHDLPILLVSETGLIGVSLLLLAIRKHLKQILKPRVLTLVALVIITGAFDHYWWTLPQNRLILLLAGVILL